MTAKKVLHQPKATTVFLHGFSGEGKGLRQFADVYAGSESICINMPGFGGTKAVPGSQSGDIRAYCKDVWAEIRRQVPSGKIVIVGHSHGAMIGYVLGVQHPADIDRLDLFCPVARPRFVPRLMIGIIRFFRGIGVSSQTIIDVCARPLLVSIVTRYTSNPTWTSADRQRITKMRQREARFYSPVMFDLMQQTREFTRLMADSYCDVPTQICYVNDENVASNDDYRWYQAHCNVTKIKEISGGHLCVVANPNRVAKLFTAEEKI